MTKVSSLEESLLAYKCQSPDCGFYFTQKVDWGDYSCPRCKYATKPLFDYYHLFSIDKEFDINLLKEQYRQLSLRYHPDKSNSEFSDEFIAVRKGYETLSNETEKDIYDQELLIFNNFLEGKPNSENVEEEKGLDRGGGYGWLILFLVGIAGGGVIYSYTGNYYYTGFTVLCWLAAAMVWREFLLKGIVYLVEVAVIFAIGYTLFQQKWVETLILSLGLIIYFLIKRNRSRSVP